MLFLELAAQAVRGFSPSIRLALKPGYTALKSPSDLPAPLSGLIVALSFPDGRGGDVAYLAPGQKSGRAGLSIQGNDGSVWRIVRDLGGSGGLHKLNRATNQFEIVSQEAGEMGQALRSGAGFPARTTWEQLFTLTGPQLPTRRPKGPAAQPQSTSGSMKSLPRVVSAWNMDGGGSSPSNPTVSAEDAAKLPALEAELATAKRAAEVQFRLDGVNSELYEAENKTRGGAEVETQLGSARTELDAFNQRIASLPDDILIRAQRANDEKRKFDEQIQRLQDEQQAVAANQPVAPAPLRQNQQFLASMGAALALYIGAMFLEGSLRYLALLAMVPFSLAALFALRFIEDLQGVSRQGGKGEVLVAREKKLTDDFQLSSMVVQRALTSVGVQTTEEFLSFMGRKGELAARVNQLEQQLSQLNADATYVALGANVARLKSEQDKLNQELLGMSSGYVRDVRDIEREIARIKEPPAPKPAAPPPSSSGSGFAPVPTGPTEQWDDPMPPLLMLATDLFTTDIPSLWSVLHDRSVQYITALTDRRYHGIQVDKDGHATLEAPGRTVNAKELPGKDLDLIYLAMRLTLIEKAATQHKLPVVIEDTFNTVLDAAKQPLFGRMVKHLGSLTQVLHVSGAGQNASLADAPVTI
ncbi:MAG: chromosome segregation protein SMC [Archangium sp.]